MSNHKEFPELTPKAQAAAIISLGYSIDNMDSVRVHCSYRRQLAAFLRQVIKEAGIWNVSLAFPRVIVVEDLEAIADNLHSPPPTPPTRDQMVQALQNLLMHTDDPAGCHEGSSVAEWADTIRRGIAHHCKVQP